MMKKIVFFRAIALSSASALVAGVASAQIGGIASEPTVAVPMTSNIPPGASGSWDYSVYGVCRGPDPRCYHPWVDDRQNKVLIYSRTAGPRHASIGTALAAGKNPPLNANNIMQKALIDWLAAEGIAADWTEDVTQLSNLNQYKAVIYANTSRDTHWKHGTAVNTSSAVNTTTNAHLDAAKTALKMYLQAGGGVVMIHNAVGGTEYQWPYFIALAGSQYYDHGANQPGEVYNAAPDSSTAGLPTRWPTIDEFYNFVPYPEKVKFVLMVDENTLATKRTTHPGHGKVHPMAWCQYYDGGRAFTIAIGHDQRQWQDGNDFPSQQIYHKFVVQAIKSTMGLLPFCTQ
jgi:type 1 glutamine amidotransferase